MGQFVDLTSADGFTVPAWVALPEGTPRGGLVVVQEIFGVNSHIRDVADRWAAKGYAVVAPAMFARVKPGVELGYSDADMQAGIALKAEAEALPGAGVLPDIQAAIDHAAQLAGGEKGSGKVGIFGFCWGGLLTWRAACELQGLSAAISYYGGGMTMGAEVDRQPRCPVMAHFGRRDHFITLDSVEAFGRAHPEVEVHLYDADHGFNCDQRGSYDAPAATTAAERTQDFLARHVG